MTTSNTTPEVGEDFTPTERLLRIFTDVRPGEGRIAVLMFLNIFLVLCAYYFIKPLREGWISISDLGSLSKTEVKAYTSFGQGLLLIPIVNLYGRLASSLPRAVVITRSTLFMMSNLVVFWLLQPELFFGYLPGTGIAFYVWVGIFGVFVVAQFWAYAADFYTNERGRRLIPLIAIGATAGGAMGSNLSKAWLGMGLFGMESLLLAALIPLALALLLTRYTDSRGPLGTGRPDPVSEPEPAETPAESRKGAAALVLKHRFLFAVAVITLLLNWINTNGENLLFNFLQSSISEQIAEQNLVGAAADDFRLQAGSIFYADLYGWVNWIALALQAIVASRLLKHGGFGAMLLAMPIIALGSYAMMAWLPILAVIRWMKIAENATDYSINNTARHVLWLPVPRSMVYKGKPTVDTLWARLGDGMAALSVLLVDRIFDLSLTTFAYLNILLVLIWLRYAFRVIQGHKRLSAGEPADALA